MIRTFALCIFVSACAAANQTTVGGSPQNDPGHFQVNQAGDRVTATGCFSTQEALGRETQRIFTQFMRNCLARVYMVDGKLAVEEMVSADGQKLYCTKVVYSISDCADRERRMR